MDLIQASSSVTTGDLAQVVLGMWIGIALLIGFCVSLHNSLQNVPNQDQKNKQ